MSSDANNTATSLDSATKRERERERERELYNYKVFPRECSAKRRNGSHKLQKTSHYLFLQQLLPIVTVLLSV